MHAEAIIMLVAGTGLSLLWLRGAGRIYVRRSRSGRWAYGLRDGAIRLHYGTRDTWAEAMARATRHTPRPR